MITYREQKWRHWIRRGGRRDRRTLSCLSAAGCRGQPSMVLWSEVQTGSEHCQDRRGASSYWSAAAGCRDRKAVFVGSRRRRTGHMSLPWQNMCNRLSYVKTDAADSTHPVIMLLSPCRDLHPTPKESIHFQFWWVSTQNLHHVGPMRGYGGYLIEVPRQTKLSLWKNSKWFQTSESKFEGMHFISQ